MAATMGMAARVRCTCASIRPGIRVRPPPSRTVVPRVGFRPVPTCAILPATTSTLPARSSGAVPLKMRTLVMRRLSWARDTSADKTSNTARLRRIAIQH